MKRPRWLSLGGKEMAEIRDLPAFQMLIEWLKWERAEAEGLVLTAVVKGEDAKIRAGTALAYDRILGSLNTPVALAEVEDDDFKDPARRASRKDEEDAEV